MAAVKGRQRKKIHDAEAHAQHSRKVAEAQHAFARCFACHDRNPYRPGDSFHGSMTGERRHEEQECS